jgi:low temperature requirement protein LtrA
MSVVEERGVPTAEEPDEASEKRVAPLELFFDLVFVFALTQITYLMSENPTWEGLGQGMLVLVALWWAWGAYAWLTNYIDSEQDTERLLMLGAMAAMLVAALATPHVFGDDALIFGLAYASVRWLHIFIFAEANEHVDTATAVRVLARTALPAPLLLIAAAFFDGPVQGAIWVVALAIDLAGPLVFGVRGFRVSAGHFAERFGLIVIIALGESIVAIGAGIAGVELDAGLVVAAIFGVALSAALWWAYFDMTAILSEEYFRNLRGEDRLLVARDAYSYLHLPLIAGILLVALGVKKTLGHVDEPLETVPAVALFGGIALYYAAHVAFRLRTTRALSRERLVAAVVCLALIPLGTEVDSLVALGIAAAVAALVIAYESVRHADLRRRARETAAHG